VNAPSGPGPDRRGSLTATAGAAAAAPGLTAPDDAQAVATVPGSSLIEAVLAAFQAHRVVAVGDAHACQEVHDLLLTMLSDPRLYGAASDIIVEFGNAFYQDTLDKFILAGEPVSDAGLRLVWRDTTQSPNIVLDSPVYEQVYRRVRAVNWTLPADKKIRVLAGDPPFDWSTVTRVGQVPYHQRDLYPAQLAGQSLANGRRVLLIYGSMHLLHRPSNSGRTLTTLIEQETGVRAYVVVPLRPLATDPGGVFPGLAACPRGTVIPTAGTWLGQVSAGDILPGATRSVNGQDPEFVNPWCGLTFGQLVDAGLYAGQAAELTASWPDLAVYLDPVYWAELERRNAIQGNRTRPPVDTFRQQRPPAYPLPPAGPACSGADDA
jgi:hypothetical protein